MLDDMTDFHISAYDWERIGHFAKINVVVGFAILGGYWFLRKLYSPGICRCPTQLDGKTVLITGANSGLGRESALNLAHRGARVILACRDVVKAEATATFVRNDSGNENIIVHQLDLASFKSIRDFVEMIDSTEDRLDVLLNNAGVMACPKGVSENGFETHFAVNHLGHFLLTNLLLDLLKKTGRSRVVNVTSFVHKGASMNWDDLNNDESYNPLAAYTQSKLANILFTKALSKRLQGTGVETYAANPGIVKTSLDRHLRCTWLMSKLVDIAFYLSCKTPWQGCQTQVHCSVCPHLVNKSGEYFSDCRIAKVSREACCEEDAERLWNISLRLTGLTDGNDQ